jgi:NAD(P)-dependent dehydrogenase (short-subunit alcohol dehydrogenase family)
MQRRGRWGHIFNAVGLSGHRIPDAAAGGTFFAATKHAVRCVTEGLRQEVRLLGALVRMLGLGRRGVLTSSWFWGGRGSRRLPCMCAAFLVSTAAKYPRDS